VRLDFGRGEVSGNGLNVALVGGQLEVHGASIGLLDYDMSVMGNSTYLLC
jgi:hypothetical protein